MRSGRKRSDERTRSESVAAPSLCAARRDLSGALQFARVFDQNDAVGGLGDFREQRIDERRLASRSSPATRMFLRVATAARRIAACSLPITPAAT